MQHALGRLLTHDGLRVIASEILKLAEAASVLPVTSVECERVFSAMTATKTALRNRLKNPTLNALLTIQLNGPPLAEFDFGEALRVWYRAGQRRVQFQTRLHAGSLATGAYVPPPNLSAVATSAAVASRAAALAMSAFRAELAATPAGGGAAGASPAAGAVAAVAAALGALEGKLSRLVALLPVHAPPQARA